MFILLTKKERKKNRKTEKRKQRNEARGAYFQYYDMEFLCREKCIRYYT